MFVEEYLQDVRRERFAPAALLTYARRVAIHTREQIYTNPGAVRSIWSVGLGFFAAAFLAAVVMALAYDRHLAYDFFLQTSLWILPAFTIVTASVGLMRNREGYSLSALNLPLTLTLLRVVLVPGIALFLLDRHLVLALAIFVVAALSDVADGWLARRWKQETRLGTVLDPLVDIVFNLAMLFALAAAGLLPRWVFGVAALRYGILMVGGACLIIFVGPLRIRPTWFGRFTGIVVSTLIALLTLLHALEGHLKERLLPLTEIALGVLLSATVVQVVVMGWYNLRLMAKDSTLPSGRVVGDVRWGPG
ncbi:MAG TPA: CDP-alcohol phosphatidyltransferase family protein [Candidatus Eisenbacteria bacterium]